MSSDVQTWVALGIVAATVALLVWRAVRRKRARKGGPGCGCGDPGCGVRLHKPGSARR